MRPHLSQRALGRLESVEPWLFALVAGLWVLLVAGRFYASLHWQLDNSLAWENPQAFDPRARPDPEWLWSAPLDDVFIHFDFARSLAHGYPFQWTEGNGYSSGATSIVYPCLLSLGWLIGFRGLSLMYWAAVLAATLTFSALLSTRRLFCRLPRWTSYVIPLALLSVGGLDWSLFSGMEVALLVAGASWTFVAWSDVVESHERTPKQTWGWPLWRLGLLNALLVLMRPEALVVTLVLVFDLLIRFWRSLGYRQLALLVLRMALPPAVVLGAQLCANRIFTGDFSSAGALVKLEIKNPLLTSAQVLDAYWFHLKYQLFRVAEYHFTDNGWSGWIAFLLAAVPLAFRSTRRQAVVLLLCCITWTALVAFNGQVRWQNERYAMPAVAWLLTASALGVACLLTLGNWSERRGRALRIGGWTAALVLCTGFVWGQRSRFSNQVWFFGRASRNIFEQHVQVGYLLGHGMRVRPNRVMVGDAGAIAYVSGLPGLDLIGLGGTFELPFAVASQWGEAASVELIQRLPPSERPEVMALYPSWWPIIPIWFSAGEMAEFSVRGNVICGGETKVIYRTDWSSLDDAEDPITVRPDEHVVDVLDNADVVSERSHHFEMNRAPGGFVEMKKLTHPLRPERDLWDAGRISKPGLVQRFILGGFRLGRPVRLLVRVAPSTRAQLRLYVGGEPIEERAVIPFDGWKEIAFELAPERVTPRLSLALEAAHSTVTIFHVWAVQP